MELQLDHEETPTQLSERVGRDFGVSGLMVRQSGFVLEYGVEELIEEVEAGRIETSTAFRLAQLSPDEQADILDDADGSIDRLEDALGAAAVASEAAREYIHEVCKTMDRHEDGIVYRVDIDPFLAGILLNTRHSRLRGIEPAHFHAIATAMRDGSFTWNGDAIKLDRDWRMFDGQHRMLATAKTERTLRNYPIAICCDPLARDAWLK